MSNVDINVDRQTDGRTDGRKIGRLYRTLLQAGAIKISCVVSLATFKFYSNSFDALIEHDVIFYEVKWKMASAILTPNNVNIPQWLWSLNLLMINKLALLI